MLRFLREIEMKMYCEVTLVDSEWVETFFQIVDDLGFPTSKPNVYKIKSYVGDDEYFFEDRKGLIENREISNLLIWSTEEDCLFLSLERKEKSIDITIHFDGWEINSAIVMASRIFSETSKRLYRCTEGVFFKAYFE
ncbi:hypothetical protein JCM15831A_03440 [Asaia astilbis]